MTSALIVDDNQSFLDAACTLLQREGLVVAGVASNGAEAVRLVEELEPDVVLLDIFLGEESGLDLARRLADGGIREGTSVILISTHAEDDLADLIATTPAKGFLPKADLSANAIRRLAGDPAE